jgi:hypothetical protein
MAIRRILGLALTTVMLAGCAASVPSGTPPPGSPSPSTGVATSGPGASATVAQSALADIPPGRSFQEGGGGPLSYTFREEWRRARTAAQAWRSAAFLVEASGQFVNDDGVPSSWTLHFVDRAAADEVLIVEIDPWGKVTSTRKVTGSAATSLVGQPARRIPYEIIDSDTAVALGKPAIAAGHNLDNTRDPSLGLGFGATDGSGPYWYYTLFDKSTAAYVTARIDALAGVVILVQ